MVLCYIALPVLLVMGLFSLKYRRLAKEAFECVFRTMTLRKCQSKLDLRLRTYLSAKLLKHSPRASRFTYKHFEIISWIFVILMIGSIIASAPGLYNYARYGNCYGEDSDLVCPLPNWKVDDDTCLTEKCIEECGCETPEECTTECDCSEP
ncbi:MAG: hypothetical protein ABIF40_03320 [archaeon]